MSLFKFFTYFLLISLVCGQVPVNKVASEDDLTGTEDGTGEVATTAAPTTTKPPATPPPEPEDTSSTSGGGGDVDNTSVATEDSSSTVVTDTVEPAKNFAVISVVAELEDTVFNVTELEVSLKGGLPAGKLFCINGDCKADKFEVADAAKNNYKLSASFLLGTGVVTFKVGYGTDAKAITEEETVYVGCANGTRLYERGANSAETCPSPLVGTFDYSCNYEAGVTPVPTANPIEHPTDELVYEGDDYAAVCQCPIKITVQEGKTFDYTTGDRHIGATTTGKLGNCNPQFTMKCEATGWKAGTEASCSWDDSASMLTISSILLGLVFLIVIF